MHISDPSLKSASRPHHTSWFADLVRAPLARRPAAAPVPRPPRQRLVAYAMLAVGSLCITLYSFATLFASPLSTSSAGSAAWSVEVAATGDRPVTVLAFGREVGLHLVRVPSANSGDPARVIPARLADAELHLISLGWSPLSVRTAAPPGQPAMSLAAQSRTVTVFQTPDRTGVRNGW